MDASTLETLNAKGDIFHVGIKCVIQRDQGEVLMVQNIGSKGELFWGLPGGRIKGEVDIAEVARREILEEIGVPLTTQGELLGAFIAPWTLPIKEASVRLLLVVVKGSIDASLPIILSDEQAGYEWCAPAEVAKKLAAEYPTAITNEIARL